MIKSRKRNNKALEDEIPKESEKKLKKGIS